MRKTNLRKIKETFLSGIGVPEDEEFVPDDFQVQAIESLNKENDTLVIAPTGSGKTFIAVEAIRDIVSKGKRAVYTAPLKALSNAKYNEFKKIFEPNYSVGLLTGDRKIEGSADIVVATTEIYRNELYRSASNYSLVVLDEFHYLADPQRGPVWEESIILSSRESSLLLLSASISNSSEIAEWMSLVRGKETNVIIKTGRPVELRLGFIHPDLGVIPIADKEGEVLSAVNKYYSQGNQKSGSSRNFKDRSNKKQYRNRRR